MEEENIILSELDVFSHMQNIDLIQMLQYYEKQVTLRQVKYKGEAKRRK
jgi:hypothetical protein